MDNVSWSLSPQNSASVRPSVRLYHATKSLLATKGPIDIFDIFTFNTFLLQISGATYISNTVSQSENFPHITSPSVRFKIVPVSRDRLVEDKKLIYPLVRADGVAEKSV